MAKILGAMLISLISLKAHSQIEMFKVLGKYSDKLSIGFGAFLKVSAPIAKKVQ